MARRIWPKTGAAVIALFMFVISMLTFATPSHAVTANCSTGKLRERGWADCTGSGGYFRIRLDCPWSSDFVSSWYRLRSYNTHVEGTCEPFDVRDVYVETKSG